MKKYQLGALKSRFDAWLAFSRSNMTEHGADWMEAHTPGALLLLQTSGG